MSSPTDKEFKLNMDTDRKGVAYKERDKLEIRPAAKKLLHQYAKIPEDRISEHVLSIRDRAWDIAPYPSIGQMTWLNPYLLLHPAYTRVLARLKDGASIIDCGCCFSTDLRQLALDGAPTKNMYGFDVHAGLIDIGYELFQDRDTFKGDLFRHDFLNKDDRALDHCRQKMDVILSAKFVHIWDHEHQIERTIDLINLLKPEPGVMFMGTQNGFPGTHDVPLAKPPPGFQSTFRLQDEDSMRGLWKVVEERTGTKWDLEVKLIDLRTLGMHKDDGTEFNRHTGYNIVYLATRQ